MIFILASTNLLTTRIAAGCFILALVVVLFVADNVSSLKYVWLFQIMTFFICLVLLVRTVILII